MVGVHVIDEKKDLTSQTMISPVQLKPELRTKLVRIFLVLAIAVQDEALVQGLIGILVTHLSW